jgi:hypothetical protein
VIIDTPLLLFFFFAFKEPTLLFVVLAVIFVFIDGLVFLLGFLGKKMSYKLGIDEFTINFGFSKRRIPYSIIRNVTLTKTTLVLRLFGASWPGFHYGLYKAKDVGKIWVYSTRMRGDFVLVELVDSKKIAISPENPESFLKTINSLKSRFGTSHPSEVKGFETSARLVYLQVATVAATFFIFLGYLVLIYPLLPEYIPLHFDFNLNPNRWGHKSELFIIAGIAAIFPIINTILALKFGKYGKELLIFLGVVFTLIIALFFGIVYFTQSII